MELERFYWPDRRWTVFVSEAYSRATVHFESSTETPPRGDFAPCMRLFFSAISAPLREKFWQLNVLSPQAASSLTEQQLNGVFISEE
jgi:hypothetical protein